MMRAAVATEADLQRALCRLSGLPLHPSVSIGSPEVWAWAWRVCLSDDQDEIAVAAIDLDNAVTAIRDGALGHRWHPSPPELRMLCNVAAEWRERGVIAAGAVRH